MRTSAAALELDFTEPSITAAKAVACAIAQNGSLQRDTLLWLMEQAYGSSSADGRWSLRDAYDMLELAQVFHLERAILPSDPALCLAKLVELVANLPTHTVRSEEQIELQQFSTPAPIAYLAAVAARIAPTDLVLEPSAGNRAPRRVRASRRCPPRPQRARPRARGDARGRVPRCLRHASRRRANPRHARTEHPTHGGPHQPALLAQYRSSCRPVGGAPPSPRRAHAPHSRRPLCGHPARPLRYLEQGLDQGDGGVRPHPAPAAPRQRLCKAWHRTGGEGHVAGEGDHRTRGRDRLRHAGGGARARNCTSYAGFALPGPPACARQLSFPARELCGSATPCSSRRSPDGVDRLTRDRLCGAGCPGPLRGSGRCLPSL